MVTLWPTLVKARTTHFVDIGECWPNFGRNRPSLAALLTNGGAFPQTRTATYVDACWTISLSHFDKDCSRGHPPGEYPVFDRRRSLLDDLTVSLRRRMDEMGRFAPSPPADHAPLSLPDHGRDNADMWDDAGDPTRRPHTPPSGEGSPKRPRHDEERHDTLLVGSARTTEVRLDTLSPNEMGLKIAPK